MIGSTTNRSRCDLAASAPTRSSIRSRWRTLRKYLICALIADLPNLAMIASRSSTLSTLSTPSTAFDCGFAISSATWAMRPAAFFRAGGTIFSFWARSSKAG